MLDSTRRSPEGLDGVIVATKARDESVERVQKWLDSTRTTDLPRPIEEWLRAAESSFGTNEDSCCFFAAF